MPYIFVAIIWVVPISQFFYHWDRAYLISKYVFCIGPSQLWFLWMLFWLFVFGWPMWKVICINPMLGNLISIAFYCIGIVGSRVLPDFFCIWTACEYFPYFYFGVRIRQKEENEEKIAIYHVPFVGWLFLDLMLFAGSNFLAEIERTGLMIKIIHIGVIFLSHIAGALMAFVVLQRVADSIDWKQYKWVQYLSLYSMPLYLFHQQIIYFVIVWLNGKVSPYIGVCANFIIAFAGAFAISVFLMRYKFTRFLIGER